MKLTRVKFTDGTVGYQQGGSQNFKNKEAPVEAQDVQVSEAEAERLLSGQAPVQAEE